MPEKGSREALKIVVGGVASVVRKDVANYAYELGFLREKPDLSNLYSLDLLKKVLAEGAVGSR